MLRGLRDVAVRLLLLVALGSALWFLLFLLLFYHLLGGEGHRRG